MPAGPRCTGVTTCTWSPDSPNTRGIESVTSCTTRRAACADPLAGTITTSLDSPPTGAVSSPLRTDVASRAIAPPSVCRYSVVSSVTGNAAGVEDVAEHPARTDGRELRRIADQHQMGRVRDRGEQGGGEFDVEHRHLVDHDQVRLDRIVGIVLEDGHPVARAAPGAEQAVHRRRIVPGQFRQALGGPAGGCSERDGRVDHPRQLDHRGDGA